MCNTCRLYCYIVQNNKNIVDLFFQFAVLFSMNNNKCCRDKRITDEVTKIPGEQRSNDHVYISPIFVFVESIGGQNAIVSHFAHEFPTFLYSTDFRGFNLGHIFILINTKNQKSLFYGCPDSVIHKKTKR